MERIIKLLILIITIGFISQPVSAAAASTPQTYNPYGAPVKVTLPQCIKTFNAGYEKLFFLTEASIVNNNFNIEEIQSQGGYIVFSAGGYKFLATVISFGTNKAILKITPCNNNYTFPPLIIKNVFRYIEANQYKKF